MGDDAGQSSAGMQLGVVRGSGKLGGVLASEGQDGESLAALNRISRMQVDPLDGGVGRWADFGELPQSLFEGGERICARGAVERAGHPLPRGEPGTPGGLQPLAHRDVARGLIDLS